MIATYLTILIVSSLNPDGHDYVAVGYKDVWDCGEVLRIGGSVWADNNMFARCIRTNIITSTSTPLERPDNLMEAYTNDD